VGTAQAVLGCKSLKRRKKDWPMAIGAWH
jgi:hypothetical protein